jgi:hypothetical protein
MPFHSCWVLVGAAVLLTIASVSAQDRPNFSGEWVLIEPSIELPSVVTVVQNEEIIRIETRSARDTERRMEPSSGTYRTVDEAVAPIPGERSGVRWAWKDGTMVVTFEGGKFIPGAGVQEVWSLYRRGRLIVTTAVWGPNAARTTRRFVYRRSR